MPSLHRLLRGKISVTLANIRCLIAILIFSSSLLVTAQGLRAEPVTVAALGDSLVHGYGLLPDQGFVARMQAWLDAQGLEIVLINAGVSGDTTAGGLSRMDWTLTPDVDALIVSLGGNDALRGIDPAQTKENLDAILAKAAEHRLPVLLVGIMPPANFAATYQEEFQAIFPALAKEYDTLFYPDFLGVLTAKADRAAVLRDFFQTDGLHPNALGVEVIVEDMGPSVAELVRAAADQP